MSELDDMFIAAKEAIRKSLCEAANREIERQKHKFECEMGKVKSELIASLMNNIKVEIRNEMPRGEFTIQIVIKEINT